MIELPESIVLSTQVNAILKDKTIIDVIVNASPHKFAFFSIDPQRYRQCLLGKTIRGAYPHGGQLELVIDDIRLFFGDGACPRYLEPFSPPPAKHQLMIVFNDRSAMYVSIAMYGMMYLQLRDMEPSPYIKIAIAKPSPFSDLFTLQYFETLVVACPENLSVKAMLATQQRIPGLGNGCLQDILFFAKLHPKRKTNTLDGKQIEILYHSICDTLRQMAGQGGRSTEKDLMGNYGGYVPVLYAKTVGKACPVCSTMIKKEPYLGGSITFCPQCQPLLVR
jgi:formamidopyrimidine-DNA glycosylase